MSFHHQFAVFTLGYRFAVVAQQHPFRRRTWGGTPHGCRLVGLVDLVDKDGTHGLCHAVVVQQDVAVARTLVHDFLAAGIYHLQRCRAVVEVGQHGRTDEGVGDAVLLDIVFQLLDVEEHVAGIEMQLSASLQHGKVRHASHEVEGCRGAPYHIGMVLVQSLVGVVVQAVEGVQDALGLAGGTAGVDEEGVVVKTGDFIFFIFHL